jgi:hypothetical protein
VYRVVYGIGSKARCPPALAQDVRCAIKGVASL